MCVGGVILIGGVSCGPICGRDTEMSHSLQELIHLMWFPLFIWVAMCPSFSGQLVSVRGER